MKLLESESEIQSAFFSWLALHEKKHPELALFYSIPNGANKSITARMRFQREGLKSGVPDCHLPLPMPGEWIRQNGLWIEFKSKRGKVADAQWKWITMLRLAGHRVEICRSWVDAANITIEYLGLPMKKL